VNSKNAISNRNMIIAALLAIALDIVGFIIVRLQARPPVSIATNIDLGDISFLVRVGSISGVLCSIIAFAALILGLNQDPRKKVVGVITCLIALALLITQAVTFVGVWIRNG
jgi:hypothetical protein